MRSFIRTSLWALLLAAGPAAAAPRIRAATTVRVKVGNGTRKGIGLRNFSDGWHLDLGGLDSVAEVIDVTPGAPARTLTLAAKNQELLFDTRRFVPGHAYQVQLYSGDARRGTLWVLLLPGPRVEQSKELQRAPKEPPQHLRFVDDEPTASEDSIQPVAKSF